MNQLFLKYRGQEAPLLWPEPSEPQQKLQEFVRNTIEKIVVVARAPPIDIWHTLLAMCERSWRNESDRLLGVTGMPH